MCGKWLAQCLPHDKNLLLVIILIIPGGSPFSHYPEEPQKDFSSIKWEV